MSPAARNGDGRHFHRTNPPRSYRALTGKEPGPIKYRMIGVKASGFEASFPHSATIAGGEAKTKGDTLSGVSPYGVVSLSQGSFAVMGNRVPGRP